MPEQNAAKKPLMPIGDLLSKSWDLYLKNWKTYVLLVLVQFVPYLLFLVFAGTSSQIQNSDGLGVFSLSFAGLFFLILIIVQILVSIALILFTNKTSLSVKEALRQGVSKFWAFLLVSILAGLAVLAGYILLIIPGIIFSVWFLFSAYSLLIDGNRGAQALKASKALVEGRWWPVFGRLFLITLLGFILSIITAIPVVGVLVMQFFWMPFVVIFFYLLYQGLKK